MFIGTSGQHDWRRVCIRGSKPHSRMCDTVSLDGGGQK